MLYTGVFFVQLYNNFYIEGRGYPLKNMPLWIALYTSIPGNPQIPPDVGGWTRWRIWQYSETEIIFPQVKFSNLETLKLSSVNLKKIWDDSTTPY